MNRDGILVVILCVFLIVAVAGLLLDRPIPEGAGARIIYHGPNPWYDPNANEPGKPAREHVRRDFVHGHPIDLPEEPPLIDVLRANPLLAPYVDGDPGKMEPVQ